MRLPSPTTWPLLAVLCLSIAACGSVANRSGTGGASGSDAGTGGSDNGGGGSTGAGGSGSGGVTGGAGGAPADAGASDGPRMIARGAITPFGILAPASGATVHVTHQRFGPTFACSGNVCFSGGLLLP